MARNKTIQNIVVASVKSWNLKLFEQWTPPAGFNKILISSKEQLISANLQKIAPSFVFFPHWSWKIPQEVFENFVCVVFHMTDLPFGRGGSPLQNLIVRGVYDTKISAIRVVEEMDAGPVYMKETLDLSVGSAQELYEKAARKVFGMMTKILIENLMPVKQSGDVVVFKRRKPSESELPDGINGRALYDFIRMLDAEGYPRAFTVEAGRKIEFFNAELRSDGSVSSNVEITEEK